MDNERAGRITECYRRFIAAIVQQAIKDNAVEFLEIPEVKDYCVTAGIDPAERQYQFPDLPAGAI
jgi:ribosome-binding factor A